MPEPASLKDQLFTACAAKRCCEVDTVHLTAADGVRIARTLAVPLAAFAAALPARPGDPDAFELADGHVRLVLAHRGDPGPCIFLLRVHDGSGRCSLGAGRPTPCRTFPCTLDAGVVRVRGESCTCRAWSLADVDAVEERALLDEEARERAQHRALAARWNAEHDPAATLADLHDYLMAEAGG